MLNNTLNTNEVKNSAGTEVEFQSLGIQGRSHEYAAIAESPALPHRLKVSHQETGKGIKLTRRSVVRIDKTIVSTVDNVTPVTISFYVVAVIPVGALATIAEAANVNAELLSFCASLGASTTILYDGTGNGSSVLLNGGI
jgi:hypothetical protein